MSALLSNDNRRVDTGPPDEYETVHHPYLSDAANLAGATRPDPSGD